MHKWLGLATDLHEYSEIYADIRRPLSNIFKKDMEWCWTSTEDEAFKPVKESLRRASILALPDSDRPFSVVCDASDLPLSMLCYKQILSDARVLPLVVTACEFICLALSLSWFMPIIRLYARRFNHLTSRIGWPVGFHYLQNTTSG